MRLAIGTRTSALALRQAAIVVEMIRIVRPAVSVVVYEFSTTGDNAPDVPIDELDPDAFTDTLEDALRSGEIDAAVHSYKDLPFPLPRELLIGAVPVRADPREALVSRASMKLAELPPGAIVGVSSLRRSEAVSSMRPDLVLRSIRGAVDARVAKVLCGEYDATVLALAGLERLDLMDHVAEVFDTAVFPPAAGQGALAVQCRRDDVFTRRVLREIDDHSLHASVDAERFAASDAIR